MGIGVFDSGVGGLSVLREIRRELPRESLLYVADSAHAPYGDRPASFVLERSRTIADFLIAQGATSLVVACNTATASAIDSLRSAYDLPIIGVEPAVKPAVARTRSGVVGVLTTSRTAVSDRFRELLTRVAGSTRLLVQPCPGWVELVERGTLDGDEVDRLVAQYVTPLRAQGADVLVSGCTHYSFLSASIGRVAGPGVELIDPAPAVARHLHRTLAGAGLLVNRPGRDERYWTSADPARASALMSRLLGADVGVSQLPEAVRAAVFGADHSPGGGPPKS